MVVGRLRRVLIFFRRLGYTVKSLFMLRNNSYVLKIRVFFPSPTCGAPRWTLAFANDKIENHKAVADVAVTAAIFDLWMCFMAV